MTTTDNVALAESYSTTTLRFVLVPASPITRRSIGSSPFTQNKRRTTDALEDQWGHHGGGGGGGGGRGGLGGGGFGGLAVLIGFNPLPHASPPLRAGSLS
jgi:hypothetical protein